MGQEEQEPDREVTFSGHRGRYAERNSGQQEIAPRLRDSTPEDSAEADNYDRGYDYESPRSQITEEWAETFDLEQAQRCQPGAELDEYLHRTSMTYPAFVLIRDISLGSEDLRQRLQTSYGHRDTDAVRQQGDFRYH